MFLLSYWQLTETATIHHKAVRFNRTASSVGNIEYKEGVHEKRIVARGIRDFLPPEAAKRLQLEDALVVVVDGLDFRRGEFPIAGLGVFNRHRGRGRAHERTGDVGLRQHPVDCDFGNGCAAGRAAVKQLVMQRIIVCGAAGKARV